ncbi:tyrosine recombinase XerD [Sesbania bispinosa]|nr:tyrosine recombinase XerD [Sesbania bispinosa]
MDAAPPRHCFYVGRASEKENGERRSITAATIVDFNSIATRATRPSSRTTMPPLLYMSRPTLIAQLLLHGATKRSTQVPTRPREEAYDNNSRNEEKWEK